MQPHGPASAGGALASLAAAGSRVQQAAAACGPAVRGGCQLRCQPLRVIHACVCFRTCLLPYTFACLLPCAITCGAARPGSSARSTASRAAQAGLGDRVLHRAVWRQRAHLEAIQPHPGRDVRAGLRQRRPLPGRAGATSGERVRALALQAWRPCCVRGAGTGWRETGALGLDARPAQARRPPRVRPCRCKPLMLAQPARLWGVGGARPRPFASALSGARGGR